MAKLGADFYDRVLNAVHAEARLGFATDSHAVAERTGCHVMTAAVSLDKLNKRGLIQKIGQDAFAPRHYRSAA